MALTADQSIQLYGTPAYTGWGETEAMYDARAKGLNGSNGDMFDFEKQSQQAYNDLGQYYDRLLTESNGDINKAISRLVEDYDRGIRMKREDVNLAKEQLGIEQTQANRGLQDNALARGLYQQSAYGSPSQGYGIYGRDLMESNDSFGRRNTALDTGLSRYETEAGVNKERQTTDLTEQQKRNQFNLEQQRRQEAAGLAQSRISRSLQRYDSTLI